MRYRALSDVRVVDLTHFIAGPYATKLLADMGADVVKVEPPWGDGGRKLGPNRAGNANEERGGLFAFLNLNKRGVTLNLKHERGRELFAGLLDGADLLIENFAPGSLAALGLAPDELIAKFPKLSVISISNFGQDGPERDARLNDLVLFARGGWTFPVGEQDREPLTPPGSLAQYVAALYGAIAAMQALAARDMGLEHGQHLVLGDRKPADAGRAETIGRQVGKPGLNRARRFDFSEIDRTVSLQFEPAAERRRCAVRPAVFLRVRSRRSIRRRCRWS